MLLHITITTVFMFIFQCTSLVKAIRCFQSHSAGKRHPETCQSSHACYVRAFVGRQRTKLLPVVLKSLRFGCIEKMSAVEKCDATKKIQSKSQYEINCCNEEDFCNLPATLRGLVHKSKASSYVESIPTEKDVPGIKLASIIMPSISIAVVVLATSVILYKVYTYRKAVKKYESNFRFQFPAKSRSTAVTTVLSPFPPESAIRFTSGKLPLYKSSTSLLLTQLEKGQNYFEYEKNLDTLDTAKEKEWT